ncbi:hypothetical protein DRP53_08095 [candidate division WOR-3 bacterium]|uniref:Digeranylgeranylglycerophospholipid reductase catalytic domain-containing protein n=1 Tax=candidate division WOR-3 bacterium TaxID=2052148 RepID=A0A660SF88_UNCW3|nr:MAG: hypothetical protein DRP53_08095 [candidate division WOR-3 bacterium]
MDFEIVVCGAGPAGSTAAYHAARGGASVLIIDRKEHPGIPVCCAEGVSRSMIKGLVELDPDWISTRLQGGRVIAGDETVEINYPKVGFILDRERFDLGLLRRAISAGAEFIVGEITSITEDHLIINGKKIHFQIPILADGVESRLARMLGFDTGLDLSQVHSCAQFLITGIDHPQDRVSFILDREMIPGGYGWVFPKGEGRFNFGLGITPTLSEKSALECLLSLKERYFPEAEVLKLSGGVVPAKVLKIEKSGLFLIGDAGRLTDPISGGGIANAIRSGWLAGRYAARMVKGKADIRGYYRELRRVVLDEIRFHERIRSIFLKLKNEDFIELVRVLKKIYQDRKVDDINSKELVFKILRISPRLFRIGLRLLI